MIKRGGKPLPYFLREELQPRRYEIDVRGRKFIFEPRMGEKVEPERGEREAPWVIRVMPRREGLRFQCQCNHVNLYFLTVEPAK